MVYCPKCWMKNKRKAEACIDCGHVFTRELKNLHARRERRELACWLVIFLVGCGLFALGFALMAHYKPLAAEKAWLIWLVPCLCIVLIVWPRRLSCLLFPGNLSKRRAQSVAYRTGSRMNMTTSIRHAGLYLLTVNTLVLYLRALF